MKFLIDTTILLHAVNSGSPFHKPARSFLSHHLTNRTSWCTTWPITYEFLRVATHRKVFPRPLSGREALGFLRSILTLEEVSILKPGERHLEVLGDVIESVDQLAGHIFHDVHTATLMREHGLTEIITTDASFSRFTFLRATNPLLPT